MNRVKFSKSLSVKAVSLAGALLLAACSKPAPVEEPLRAVKVVTVGLQARESAPEWAGEVRARVESRLGFRVAGKLIRRNVEVGQRVKAGQVLAQIDPQDYALAADAARAQVNAASANRDLAAAEFKRYQALRAQNFISGAELERRDTTLKAAQAQWQQAQAQAAEQGHQLAYATLVADVSGVVTAVEAEPGQVVTAGAPIVRIAQDGPREVAFAVPEGQVAALPVGTPATVRVWASGATLTGVVREVAASADPVTRTFLLKLALQGDAPALGSTVSVLANQPELAGVPVIKLPTSALRQEGAGTAVWLLDPASMTVKLQPVQIAMTDGNEVVIGAGLQPGMQVVAAGVHVLTAGQKVSLYKEKVAKSVAIVSSIAPDLIAKSAASAAAAK